MMREGRRIHKKLLYKKTGTVHYIGKDWQESTMCSVPVDEENWTEDTTDKKRVCKRCRVASGVPGRHVYKYGFMAWKRSRGRW